MTFPDLVALSLGNLGRMKLRTFLTVSGVVIAIAAFVAMLSFGAGMQQNVAREFRELGLLTTAQVFPSPQGRADSARVTLDDAAVEALSRLPGVELAYPLDDFAATVAVGDSEFTTSVQALPAAAARTKLYSRLASGTGLGDGAEHEALVTHEFLKRAGIDRPDSAPGRRIVLTVEVASLDSGVVELFRGLDRNRIGALGQKILLGRSEEVSEDIRGEVAAALERFLEGYLHERATLCDTLVIRGVLDYRMGGPGPLRPVLVDAVTARRLAPGRLGDSPADLFAYLSSGAPIDLRGDSSARVYPQVTLSLDPRADAEALADSVEAMGYRVFSFAREFREMRKFFLLFDVALGVVGFIALVVASLGIVNTLVTSIVERRREIGILKSLGADESCLRTLFLVEAAMIGAVGSAAGILLGWALTRVAAVGAGIYMERQGIPKMDPFALPLWLVLTGFFFGLAVSLAAGSYPATRAAAVDPVEALRSE